MSFRSHCAQFNTVTLDTLKLKTVTSNLTCGYSPDYVLYFAFVPLQTPELVVSFKFCGSLIGTRPLGPESGTEIIF